MNRGPYYVVYHYLHDHKMLEDKLNELHADGWEVVSVYMCNSQTWEIVVRGKNWKKVH